MDAIKTEELALYLGAKLQVRTDDQIRAHHLMGITDQTAITDSLFQCEFALSDLHPVVRSLSLITEGIEHEGELFVPAERLCLPWPWHVPAKCLTLLEQETRLQQVALVIFQGGACYQTMRQLAMWHFDVFNWLNRRNKGGALALPMGLHHWGDNEKA